jgi:hypothetical protein
MRFLDPKAIKDWIKSRAVNSMMATEKGFFMDARQGPVIREELDGIQTGLDEINSKLSAKGNTTWLGGVVQQNNAISFGNLSNYKTLHFRLSIKNSAGYDFFTTLDFPVSEVTTTTSRLVMHLPLAANESVIIWGMFNVSQFYLNSVDCIGNIAFRSLDIWGIK